MEFSQDTNNLFTALTKFQNDCPKIKKNAKVKVYKNGQFKYDFEYATYGNILSVVKPVLSKYELSVVQNVSARGVQTVVVHSSGQWMKSDYLPILLNTEGENTNIKEQDTGSSITYKKRYQLAAMLLQDADVDDDANTADGNEPEFVTKPEPTPVKKKSTPKKNDDSESSSKATTPSKKEDKLPASKNERETSGTVEETIVNITDKTELVEWWKDQMNGDDGTFRDKYMKLVYKRLEELK